MRLVGLVVSAAIAAALAACSVPSEKPTRTECIVGYRLDWSGVKADPNDVLNKLWVPPRTNAALVISIDGSRLYLQFRERCYERSERAAALINHWKQSGTTLPEFIRIQADIAPSVETIDVRGPSWRD